LKGKHLTRCWAIQHSERLGKAWCWKISSRFFPGGAPVFIVRSLIAAGTASDCQVYLLIDEYDNFANEVMKGGRREWSGLYLFIDIIFFQSV